MKIAIIGLPNSGKTTVFNALTRGSAETTNYASGQLEPNISTVKVPDTRLNRLSDMFNPRKQTPADVQYVDVGGISGERQSNGLPGALLNYIQGADAFLHVVRAFDDDAVPHPQGSVNAARDISSLDLELMFSDMAIIERRLQRLNAEINKMSTKDKELRSAERDALLTLQTALENEIPVRDVALSEDDDKLLRGYQFLSAKPMLVVVNVGDDQITDPPTVAYDHQRSDVVSIAGKIEAELAQMDDDDAKAFMDDLGISEAARDRAIKKSYDLLGLIKLPDRWPGRGAGLGRFGATHRQSRQLAPSTPTFSVASFAPKSLPTPISCAPARWSKLRSRARCGWKARPTSCTMAIFVISCSISSCAMECVICG